MRLPSSPNLNRAIACRPREETNLIGTRFEFEIGRSNDGRTQVRLSVDSALSLCRPRTWSAWTQVAMLLAWPRPHRDCQASKLLSL